MDGRILAMYEKAVVAAGKDNQFNTTQLHVAHKFAEMIIAYDREQCAKMCERQLSSYLNADESFNKGVRACAKAIRETKE